MASKESFVIHIVEQIKTKKPVTYKKMFGEYGLYVEDKIVALVCDNKLFVKKTEAGTQFGKNLPEKPPYPNAKPSLYIEDKLDDAEWLTQLFEITAKELPIPTPKKKKIKNQRKKKATKKSKK